MPKAKIEAKKVLEDIRAGLDDAALMEKYNLSIKGLHSVLEKLVTLKALDESYIWVGRPPRETGGPAQNRELSAKEVTRDIKAGMTDGALMRKYKLSAKGLQNLLEQLIEAGLIKASDLELGKPIMESTVELTSDMLPPVGEDIPETTEVPAPEVEVPPKTELPQEKAQEVQIVETVNDAFPSTVPITVALEHTSEPTDQPPALPEQEPAQSAPQEPHMPPETDAPAKDIWADTIAVNPPVDDKPADQAPILVPQADAAEPQPEKSPRPVMERTVELIWQCPACGQRQPKAYKACPDCGVVEEKYLELRSKKPETEAKPDEEKPAAEARKPRSVPSPAKTDVGAKPRKSAARQEPTPDDWEQDIPVKYGRLASTLKGLGVAQLIGAIVYVCVRIFLDRGHLLNAGFLGWAVVVPILISCLVLALFLGLAGLVSLNMDILKSTMKQSSLLRQILGKLDKHSE